MNGDFGPGAARLSGAAARWLHWRPHEFWSATPAELVAALQPPGTESGIDRDALKRMMDQEHA